MPFWCQYINFHYILKCIIFVQHISNFVKYTHTEETRRKICHGSPDYFPLQFWTYFLHLNWPCWGMNFKAGHLLLALVRQDSLSPTTPHPTWACSSWLDLTHWLVFLSDSLRLRCSFTFTLGFSQSTEGNWAIAIWWCLPFPFVLCSPRASVLSAHSSALSWEFPLTFQILILHFYYIPCTRCSLLPLFNT